MNVDDAHQDNACVNVSSVNVDANGCGEYQAVSFHHVRVGDVRHQRYVYVHACVQVAHDRVHVRVVL